jgi:hypothetical protein
MRKIDAGVGWWNLQLDKKSEVRVLALGGRTPSLAEMPVVDINTHLEGCQQGRRLECQCVCVCVCVCVSTYIHRQSTQSTRFNKIESHKSHRSSQGVTPKVCARTFLSKARKRLIPHVRRPAKASPDK